MREENGHGPQSNGAAQALFPCAGNRCCDARCPARTSAGCPARGFGPVPLAAGRYVPRSGHGPGAVPPRSTAMAFAGPGPRHRILSGVVSGRCQTERQAGTPAWAPEGAIGMAGVDGRRPSIYPSLLYADAKAAIKQLTEAFGFTELSVYEGEDGSVLHAELVQGNGAGMIGS